MPVVACPECAKKLNVPDSAAGKKIRCPGCQAVFPVPGGPARPSPSAATPAPRAAPDLDDAPTPMPAAVKFKKRAEPEPLPEDGEDAPARGAVAGLRCPKCDAEAVKALPPNQFSRRPGYVCTACDTVLRRAGTKGNFFAAMGLGAFIVLLGIAMAVLSFDAPRRQMQMLGGSVGLAALGATVAGWAFKQSRLPEPVGAKAPPSRVGFWILVFVIGLLLLGGAIFGLMYYMQEMM